MSETRLEKVIESTAEAETELTPETRLEKVILDTGRKIQEEIAEGGGGKLYNHYLTFKFDKYNIYINFQSSNNEPYTTETFRNVMYSDGRHNIIFTGMLGLTSSEMFIRLRANTTYNFFDADWINYPTHTASQYVKEGFRIITDIITEL